MSGPDTAIRITVPAVIGRASAAAFLAAMQEAGRASARVIVLQGRDGVFCTGLDVACLASGDYEEDVAQFRAALLAVRQSFKPVIAAVDGAALGGGVGLAAAADVIIATGKSTFGLPEALVGLAPALIFPFLLDRMPPQQYRFWALAPHARTAAEAARVGLVDILTTADRLEQSTEYWVRQLSRALPESVRAIKRMGGGAFDSCLREATAAAMELLTNAKGREDLREHE